MARDYEIKESDLREWNLVKDFRKVLKQVIRAEDLAGTTWEHGNRKVQLCDYLSLFLFALYNPIFETTRAICKATHLDRVKREVCGRSVSLGSFSEAQHLVNENWLEGLFKHLIDKVKGVPKGPKEAWQQWLAQDSSVWPALPRMEWALYGGGTNRKAGPSNRAVRLHLSFNILEEKPESVRVTPGKVCERKTWRQQWQRGAAYIGDSYYGTSYQMFDELEKYGCNYILRLKDQATVNEVEELALGQAESEARIIKQAHVRLGARPKDKLYRVIWVDTPTAGILRLVTSLDAQQCPADLVAQIYRQRWQIEGFFKWLKVLFKCRSWLAESERGVTLQLYLALIASVLFQLAFGQKPNKRTLELIQAHQLGWASDEELARGLKEQLAKTTVSKKS